MNTETLFAVVLAAAAALVVVVAVKNQKAAAPLVKAGSNMYASPELANYFSGQERLFE